MKTILIIDDEKNIRILYKEIFEKEGYKVIVASNGREGLDVYKGNKIDLVILDIKLPDMDGMEVLGKFAKEESAPPIILNSAYAGYEKNVNSWLAEAYLIKSSDLTELKDRVREILNKRM